MASFTTPTSIQPKELYREIFTAFWNRWQVLAPGSEPDWLEDAKDFPAGYNLQSAGVWNAWQLLFETLLDDALAAGTWVLKTTATPPDFHNQYSGYIQANAVYNGAADISALWLAAIGASRPRRYYKSGGTWHWGYGYHQSGDAVGPWLIEDIQKALRKLKHTCLRRQGGSYNYVTHVPPETGWLDGEERERLWMAHEHFSSGWQPTYWSIAGQFHGSGSSQFLPLDSMVIKAIHRHDHGFNQPLPPGVPPGYDVVQNELGSVDDNPMQLRNLTTGGRIGLKVCAVYPRGVYGEPFQVWNICAASAVEYGQMVLSGIPSTVPHKATLYSVIDEVQQPELGVAERGNYKFEDTDPFASPFYSERPVTFRPIGYTSGADEITGGPGVLCRMHQDAEFQSAASRTVPWRPSRYFDSGVPLLWNDTGRNSPYSWHPYNGHFIDDFAGLNTEWHGCQWNDEAYWVVEWQWAYT